MKSGDRAVLYDFKEALYPATGYPPEHLPLISPQYGQMRERGPQGLWHFTWNRLPEQAAGSRADLRRAVDFIIMRIAGSEHILASVSAAARIGRAARPNG